MRKFFIESAEMIVYASSVCILIAGFYVGIQLIRFSGLYGTVFGPSVGVFIIFSSLIFAALNCAVLLAVLDIRTYTRHAAKMLTSK